MSQWTLEDLMKDLPNIPKEVVSSWLYSICNKWPLTNVDGWDVRKTGEKIQFWNDGKWEKLNLNFSKINFAKNYQDTMIGLFDAYLRGQKNAYWNALGQNGKQRFLNAFSFIVDNGVFPVPPVLMIDEAGKYQVLDGNHRFFALQMAFKSYNELSKLDKMEQDSFLKSCSASSFHEPQEEQAIWVCRPNWKDSVNAQQRNALRLAGLWPDD